MARYGNIFDAGAQGFADADAMTRSIQKRRADYQAAPMVAAGNFGGAAQQYGQAGMPDEARQNVVDQQTMDDRRKTQDLADTQRKADALLKVSKGLRSVPPGQRKAALDTLTPLWQKLNIDPTMFNQLDEAHLTDASLDAFDASLGKAAEEYTLSDNQVRYRGSTPIARGAQKPLEMDPGKNYYLPDAGPTPGQPAGQGAPSPTPADSGPAPQGGLQPRGIRNNNPLNVTSLGGGQKWDGQTGSDGRYATFSSPEAGFAAADKNLHTYATKHGINTIAGVIQRWAPSSENDTASYVQTVARDLGVDPNQPVDLTNPQNRQALLRSMAKVELGQPLPAGGSAPPAAAAPQSPAGGAPSLPGYRLVQQAKPQWQDMPDGRQRNAITGKIEGQPTEAEDAAMDPATVDIQAAMYLSTRQLPTMGMGKTGTRNRTLILNRATTMAKELGLDANDIVAGSMSVKAAGQALTKATTLRSQVEGSERTVTENAKYALSLAPKGAGPSRAPVLNRWIQAGRQQIAGDPDVAQFNQAIKTVAEEYAKVMTTSTGTGGTTSDSARQEAYHRLNSAMNPAQLKAVIDSMTVEMDNRAASLRTVEEGLRSTIRGGSGGVASGGPPAAGPAPAGGSGGWRVVKVH